MQKKKSTNKKEIKSLPAFEDVSDDEENTRRPNKNAKQNINQKKDIDYDYTYTYSDDESDAKSMISSSTKARKRKRVKVVKTGKEEYSNQNYWELKYQSDKFFPFEWYLSFDQLKGYIGKYVEGRERCLYVGCGTSTLGYDLHKQYAIGEVINVDFSKSAIDKMSSKYTIKKHCIYEVGDANKLRFKKDLFDLIIDKGMFDSIMCSEECRKSIDKVLIEMDRLLGENGYYIVISNASEPLRLSFFQLSTYGWIVEAVVKIKKPLLPSDFYYVYVMYKSSS